MKVIFSQPFNGEKLISCMKKRSLLQCWKCIPLMMIGREEPKLRPYVLVCRGTSLRGHGIMWKPGKWASQHRGTNLPSLVRFNNCHLRSFVQLLLIADLEQVDFFSGWGILPQVKHWQGDGMNFSNAIHLFCAWATVPPTDQWTSLEPRLQLRAATADLNYFNSLIKCGLFCQDDSWTLCLSVLSFRHWWMCSAYPQLRCRLTVQEHSWLLPVHSQTQMHQRLYAGLPRQLHWWETVSAARHWSVQTHNTWPISDRKSVIWNFSTNLCEEELQVLLIVQWSTVPGSCYKLSAFV